MVKFKVDLEELEKAVAIMNKQVQDYDKALKDLKMIINTINFAWQGEDSVEFINQLKNKMEENVKIIVFMKKYESLLKFGSKTYKDAQKDVIAFAKSL